MDSLTFGATGRLPHAAKPPPALGRQAQPARQPRFLVEKIADRLVPVNAANRFTQERRDGDHLHVGQALLGEIGSELVTTSSRIGDSRRRLAAGPQSTGCVAPT